VLVFHRTSAQTDGEESSSRSQCIRNGFVAAAHFEDARFTVQVRRALQFESLRLPNPLRLAVIARAHFDLSAFLSHLRRCSEQRSRSLPRSARRWATGRR
jgi:hypothetical protein